MKRKRPWLTKFKSLMKSNNSRLRQEQEIMLKTRMKNYYTSKLKRRKGFFQKDNKL